MKKIIAALLVSGALIAARSPVLYAGAAREGAKTITVGATPVPHAELLNLIAGDLAAAGYTLKVVEYNDYVQPNAALAAGDLDANFFQHLPYLESNAEWKSALAAVTGVHVEPFGLYSNRLKSIADLPNGATIAIPNDPTNGGRAFLLLQANGLLTLKPGTGLEATTLDISANPKNLRFHELESAQLPLALPDVDAAAINGNYALRAGLNPVRDSLIIEGADSPYVNYLVVKKGSENDPRIQALSRALTSQKVKDYILSHYDGGVVAVF
ncbi:MAG: MetQ/NlpA family ABC transporter substrate-binding protein [Treponema sp.]|jgi:D-methionine transport system substrate-binding protein|nr:MetQ/NlpA family ABC transporter substrate-binding protein [Treponema sp.]